MTGQEHRVGRFLCWGLVCLLPAWAAGCGSFGGFRSFRGELVVAMDPKIQSPTGVYPSLEVDVVGITNEEEARWQNYPIEQYFQAGNRFREDAPRHTMYFSDQQRGPMTVPKSHKIWQTWKDRGARKLILLANLPGVWENKPGALDGRRLMLPLDSGKWGNWFSDGAIKILVKASGLACETKMNE